MTHGVAVVDYSRPALQKLARSGVEFEFPSLPESDESTEIYLSYLAVKPGDAVLDLGAYAGASAYFFAKAAGTDGIVVAFEPDEINFQYLKANIARHHLTTVRPVEKGVWSETTSLQFQAEGNLGSSAATISGRKSNVKWVPVLSLEAAAQLTEGKRVAAIKMDIEGAEVAVLKQAGGFLRQHRPRLVIEPHSVDGKMVTEEVCQILQSYGYVTERLSQGSQNWPLIAARPAID
jgi:FkbM family methyltransferase